MIPSKREMLRRKRQKRRRIFFACCFLFFLTVIILLSLLVVRLAGRSDSEASSNPAASYGQSSEVNASGSAGTNDAGTSSGESSTDQGQSSTPAAVPDGYEMYHAEADDLHRGSLVLVNKTYSYPFPQVDARTQMYGLTDGSYALADVSVEMDPMAAPAVDAMLKDFAAFTGLTDVSMMNGYRSPEVAQELFDASAEENGLEHAEMYVMRPGFSEHHTGLATDLFILLAEGGMGYHFTEAPYDWITNNCVNYGIVLRYPPDKVDITEIGHEEWHFRYVGLPHAAAMQQLGFCLEEYISYVKQFPVDGQHLQVTAAGEAYEIYYVPASANTEGGYQIPVPTGPSYEISGNNFDGFIVTVQP